MFWRSVLKRLWSFVMHITNRMNRRSPYGRSLRRQKSYLYHQTFLWFPRIPRQPKQYDLHWSWLFCSERLTNTYFNQATFYQRPTIFVELSDILQAVMVREKRFVVAYSSPSTRMPNKTLSNMKFEQLSRKCPCMLGASFPKHSTISFARILRQ